MRAIQKVYYVYVCNKQGGGNAAILVFERSAIQFAYSRDTWRFVTLLVL